MTQPKNKEQAFNMLQDTINYYMGDVDRRSKSEYNSCYYKPTKDIECKTAGCAIGRYIHSAIASKFDGLADSSIKGIYDDKLNDLLPQWMQDMGKDFLGSLQDLHDSCLEAGYDSSTCRIKNCCEDFFLPYNNLFIPKRPKWMKP